MGGIKCTSTCSDVAMSMIISTVLEFEGGGGGQGGQEVLLPALGIDLPPACMDLYLSLPPEFWY